VSSTSTEPGGRRALFLVLEGLGFAPRAWHQAPIALPDGGATLWLSTAPRWAEMGGSTESDGGSACTELQDPRHPANYGRFVRGGGTLVAPARPGVLAWLRDSAGLEVPLWHGLISGQPVGQLTLDTGELLSVDLTSEASESGGRAEDWHDLALDEEGRAFAASCSLGEGRVLLLASDDFLTNGELDQPGRGLLAVRLAEVATGGGALLFDEYALGDWRPPSSVGLLTAPGLRELSWNLLLLLLLALVLVAWPREFPRDPAEAPMDPRVRSKAGARLLERAGRSDLLARELRLGVLRRLARRWRLGRSAAGLEEEASERAEAQLVEELGVRAGLAPARVASWVQFFRDHDHEDLEVLDRSLRAFEAELEPERPSTRRKTLK
jgi:hypothetical protein